MKKTLLNHTVLFLFAAVFTTSCYTQLQTAERAGYDGYYATTQRTAPDRRAPVEERADEIENVEDYELGYEDGWVDAEAYYFKDEETRDWYLNHGVTLASDPLYRRYVYSRPYDRDWFYSPYHYSTYYGIPHWRHGFSIHFGVVRPWRSFYGYYGYYGYDYYRYPYYDPYYYGGYWGSNWYGYYNRPIVIYNNNSVTNRSYSPRSTGFASSGRSSINRNRPDISSSRSAVRANARSSQVNSGRSTLNRSTARSGVQSRSTGRSTSRGTVNRGSSSRSGSGTVNRSGSTNRGSSGSVGRSSGNSRSGSGSVNRSSGNRSSSGSAVKRNSSSGRSGGSSASRSRSNNQQAAAVQSSSRSDVRSDTRSNIISGHGSSAIIRKESVTTRSTTYSRTADTERAERMLSNSVTDRRPLSRSAGRTVSSPKAEQINTATLPSTVSLNRRMQEAKSLPAMKAKDHRLLKGVTRAASSAVRTAVNRSSGSSSSVGRSSTSRSSGSSTVRSSGNSRSSSGVSRSSGSSSSRGTSSSSRSRSSSRNN